MIRLAALMLILWLGGLVAFTLAIPHVAPAGRADGVVVLTGGPGRVQRGLALLRSGAARRMLVSGAAPSVGPRALAHAYAIPRPLLARIDLGREAVDTRSNGEETAAWVARNRYRSIRLVTTDWHMPRARLELAHALPREVAILPEPVPSEPGLAALVREYNKYLLRRAALLAGV